MECRGLVRGVRDLTTPRGMRALVMAWRHRRLDARELPARAGERARVPGEMVGAEPLPGGGIIRFARSELRICVVAGGAVFWGWDGAGPEPSYALAAAPPGPDRRATLEPDKDGGWRVVSERVMVRVSRVGAVEMRTPGGVVLRRDLPPRWWEPAAGGSARWMVRSEVAADARFFGLGGRSSGPRLRDGTYRLWNTVPRGPVDRGDDPLSVTMPVQLVVADAGTHLAFHDSSWDGRVVLREGEEGAGSGHDRPGRVEIHLDGGPLRCWVVVGTPARVLARWTRLTGSPAAPPSWALGLQHALGCVGGERDVRRIVEGFQQRGLPLSALYLDVDHHGGRRDFALDREGVAEPPAREPGRDGVRLVSTVSAAVRAESGGPVYDSGVAVGAFVRDARGRAVRGALTSGDYVYPDFTDPQVRAWWGALHGERLARGFSGVWHDLGEPFSGAPFGGNAWPRSARHHMEGRGGDHREAHNVYGLAMARAGYEGLRRLRPDERPFVLSRSGWAGTQRYGGIWSGDVSTEWSGLRASLALVLGLGLCGVPYSGPAVGGVDGTPSDELFLRWFQLGAYLPLFRTHTAMGAGPREPWEFGPAVLEYARDALLERERLRPYFVTLAQQARLTGAPYVRPLWWGYPKDRVLRECEDAFLLGDSLLVAPVLDPGAVSRAVSLPRGRWYDTVTERAYEGPGQVVVSAPRSRIPVFARGGSVLPVRGADGATELEVWAPAAGRRGGGVAMSGSGDGWGRIEVERYTTRLVDGQVRVKQIRGDGAGPPRRQVRVRGLDAGA